jgi:leucyl aminopeptidase (aminopeptidase T)
MLYGKDVFMDPRIKELAHNLINYSCTVQPGEKVLIHVFGTSAYGLAQQLVKETYAAGGFPYVQIEDYEINRAFIIGASEEQLKLKAELDMAQMKEMDAYIGIRASDNIAELSDVPQDKLQLYTAMNNDVLNERVNHTKWVVLRYPNHSMAQLANTSLEAFEDFYFDINLIRLTIIAFGGYHNSKFHIMTNLLFLCMSCFINLILITSHISLINIILALTTIFSHHFKL